MTSAQIRQSFLDFFREKNHTIVPSSSLMPGSPNLLFTNAGMNQFVPIFLGERKPDVDTWSGAIKGSPTRAADTQKCIRAGGKHNDLDDVGLDTYHHTFFEMLGNWSFGDYFKKEAIEWAWELVVERWKFPAERLYATVYSPDKSAGDPSDFDQEAHDLLAEKFRAAGLDPAVHIVNGNKKDNFWMMGDTGPCGPCSELHVDLTPAGDTRGSLVNKGDPRCIEIWNLVFIQFNAQPQREKGAHASSVPALASSRSEDAGTMPADAPKMGALPTEFVPLAQKHVDTGMGFERVTSIIQGTRNFTDFANAKISNYETDIFRPIFDELERMSGKTYRSTLPGTGEVTGSAPETPGSPRETVSEGEKDVSTGQKGISNPQADVSPAHRDVSEPQADVSQPQGDVSHPQTDVSGPRADVSKAQRDVSEAQRDVSRPQRDVSRSDVENPKTGSENATSSVSPDQIALDIAFRVIADHIRTLSFAIADGIQPGNTDRNYVLRRILRRAVRYGRTLGFHEPFFYKLVAVLARTIGDVFPEIRGKQKQIEEVLKREEEAFNRTLDKGIELFEREVGRVSGDAGRMPADAPKMGALPTDPLPQRPTGDATGSARFQRAASGILPDAIPTPTTQTRLRAPGARFSRRNLPHYERPHGIYHITFTTHQRRILTPAARDIVLKALLHFDQIRYDLFAAVVMPDHVHVLLQPWIKPTDMDTPPVFWNLTELTHSIKSFTANEINQLEGNRGTPVWEKESHDRLMRSDEEVEEKFFYICGNAESAVEAGQDYPWLWTWCDRAAGSAGGAPQDAKHSTLEACAPDAPAPDATDRVISGAFAFRLYDEQGFPLDLTELMARERGLSVDTAGFEKLMEEQRSRARAAQKKQVIELSQIETKEPTHFLGYDHNHTGADVQEVVALKEKTAVVLNNSVCYAEMGGQVGDTGELTGAGKLWRIVNTQKSGATWLHFIEGGDAPSPGEHVTVEFDAARRAAIQRHHTVTHLLHWALHEVVSKDATQKGSSVGPEKLTFDFNSPALTPAQVRDMEKLVNEKIVENAGVAWTEVPFAEIKGRPDVMQFFGDKYGDVVRVVQIGGSPAKLDGYSMELCAGTHTRATGEIGLFKIVSEAAIAAGVRRIEAVAGLNAYDFAAADSERLKNFAAKLNAPVGEIEKKLDAMLAQQKDLEKALNAPRRSAKPRGARKL